MLMIFIFISVPLSQEWGAYDSGVESVTWDELTWHVVCLMLWCILYLKVYFQLKIVWHSTDTPRKSDESRYLNMLKDAIIVCYVLTASPSV
jgi:hypothetical protein